MKKIGERITWHDEKEFSTVVILPENNSLKNGLLLAWTLMWLFIGGYFAFEFTNRHTQNEQIALVVFLSFWAYFAYKVGRATLWQLYGKELLRIDSISMSYKRSIFKYGKAQVFYLENIRKLRVDEVKNTNLVAQFEDSIWVVGGERLSFDYMGKLIRLARKLDEKDTVILFKFISKRVDMFLKKKEK